MCRTRGDPFTAAALRGTKCAVEAKGSSWSQTMGVLLWMPQLWSREGWQEAAPKTKAGESQKWGLPAVVVGKGWGT